MPPFKDLTNEQFGDLSVISHNGKQGKFHSWLCKCKCGSEQTCRVDYLTTGRSTKCTNCKLNSMASRTNTIIYETKDDYIVGTTHLGRNFYIDIDDYEKIKDFNIVVNKLGYAKFNTDGVQYHLHRFLMKPQENEIVDHINRNPSDNRKSNLRICSISENSRNRTINSNNQTGVTGVRRAGRNWAAFIGVDGERMNLGIYETKEEAILVRKEAEKKYFGEFAPK